MHDVLPTMPLRPFHFHAGTSVPLAVYQARLVCLRTAPPPQKWSDYVLFHKVQDSLHLRPCDAGRDQPGAFVPWALGQVTIEKHSLSKSTFAKGLSVINSLRFPQDKSQLQSPPKAGYALMCCFHHQSIYYVKVPWPPTPPPKGRAPPTHSNPKPILHP